MPDERIPDLPAAASISDGDLFLKWDGTQISGQRTQRVTAALFGAYVAGKVPAYQLNSNVAVTNLAPGAQGTATISGGGPLQTLSLGLPTGTQGPPNTLTFGTISMTASGTMPSGSITGASPNQALSLTIPYAPTNSLGIGTVTTGAAGSSASATITGSAPSQTLNLSIPQGQPGTGNVNTSLPATNNALAVFSGVGGNIAAGTLAGVGAAARGANSDITSLSGLTTALSIAQGGTGQTSANAALTAIGGAPLASPALTGTPTAPTASAGTNTTQVATTAFVLANGGGSAFPSAFATKSANYTVVNADANTLFTLTGSNTLSLPSASSFGAGKGIFLKKVDGNGVWSVTPASGTIDGLSSINVYQERFALVSDGTNWQSVNRPKGWISLGTVVVSSAISAITLTQGFTDPELTEFQVNILGGVFSASDIIVMRVQKGGSIVTGATYNLDQIYQSAASVAGVAISNTTKLLLVSGGGTTTFNGDITISNFLSSTAAAQRIKAQIQQQITTSPYISEGWETTASAIQGISLFPNGAATINSGTFVERGFRP